MPVRRERVEAEDFDVSISVFLRNCRIKNLSEYTMRYYKNELIGTLRLLEMQGSAVRIRPPPPVVAIVVKWLTHRIVVPTFVGFIFMKMR